MTTSCTLEVTETYWRWKSYRMGCYLVSFPEFSDVGHGRSTYTMEMGKRYESGLPAPERGRCSMVSSTS